MLRSVWISKSHKILVWTFLSLSLVCVRTISDFLHRPLAAFVFFLRIHSTNANDVADIFRHTVCTYPKPLVYRFSSAHNYYQGLWFLVAISCFASSCFTLPFLNRYYEFFCHNGLWCPSQIAHETVIASLLFPYPLLVFFLVVNASIYKVIGFRHVIQESLLSAMFNLQGPTFKLDTHSSVTISPITPSFTYSA